MNNYTVTVTFEVDATSKGTAKYSISELLHRKGITAKSVEITNDPEEELRELGMRMFSEGYSHSQVAARIGRLADTL